MFMTPGLPFVPAIAVTVNIYLIFKLSILTLIRFTVWMIIGMYLCVSGTQTKRVVDSRSRRKRGKQFNWSFLP